MPRKKELPDLENFNTKIKLEDLQLIRALTKVGPYTSQRELLEALLQDYKEKHQATFEKAEMYMEFMKEV